MQQESKRVIVTALCANLAIAVLKFIAATINGSAAMAAEGIHSSVDTCDALLMLVGRRLAKKPADERHPFGYGKEVYFWSLIVAMVVFGAGGCVSIIDGVRRLVAPKPLESVAWSYAVLAGAFLFEGISFFVALKEFKAYRRERLPGYSFFRAIRAAKDPSIFTVVLEDSAALLGIVAAVIGLSLTVAFDEPRFDAAASVVIGVLLGAIAFILATECRGLLIGERALTSVLDEMREVVTAQPCVARVEALKTMHLGPESVWVDLKLSFSTPDGAAAAVARVGEALKRRFPDVMGVSIDASSFRQSG